MDAADYVVWRNTLGESGMNLAADGNGNGSIDPADYDFWKTRFGKSTAGSAQALDSVPEPATLMITLTAAASLLALRRTPAPEHCG